MEAFTYERQGGRAAEDESEVNPKNFRIYYYRKEVGR